MNESATALLDPLIRAAQSTAVLLDVDGTLAPIVRDSRDAAVPVPVRSALVDMGRRFGLVACVSGRQAEDARRVVGAGGLTYIGGHGSEILRSGESEATVDPSLEEWTEPVHDAAGEAIRDLSPLGIRREDKGAVSALHWRGAPDEGACERALIPVAQRIEESGLVVHWGRKVLEIRPPEPFDKGIGVSHLLAQSDVRNAIYVGDDRTDIDAMNAIADLRGKGRLDHTVAVAVESAESPPELLRVADLLVAGPEGAHALVEYLARGDSA